MSGATEALRGHDMADEVESIWSLLREREELKHALKAMENTWAEYPDHEKVMMQISMIEEKLRARGWKPSS